jgi:hypothetical protein
MTHMPAQVYVLAGDRGNEGPRVQTDGINFVGVWAHADLVGHGQKAVARNAVVTSWAWFLPHHLTDRRWFAPSLPPQVDVNKITCNDVAAMLRTYGVEVSLPACLPACLPAWQPSHQLCPTS